MEKIIQMLANLGNKLDKAKLTKAADVVDSINRNVLKITKAQYEGFQGYWIRNERCWNNCYRQKRATTKKPAQDIWFECLDEYQKSFGKDKSDWDKYADEMPNLIKSSNQQVSKMAGFEEKVFLQSVQKNIRKGMDNPSAVFASIKENSERLTGYLLEDATRLALAATELKKIGKIELAENMAEASAELSKYAVGGFGNWRDIGGTAWNWMRGKTDKKQMAGRLQNALNEVKRVKQMLPPDPKRADQRFLARFYQEINKLSQKLQNEWKMLFRMLKNEKDPSLMQAFQAIDVATREVYGYTVNMQQAGQTAPAAKEKPIPTLKPPIGFGGPAPTPTYKPPVGGAVLNATLKTSQYNTQWAGWLNSMTKLETAIGQALSIISQSSQGQQDQQSLNPSQMAATPTQKQPQEQPQDIGQQIVDYVRGSKISTVDVQKIIAGLQQYLESTMRTQQNPIAA